MEGKFDHTVDSHRVVDRGGSTLSRQSVFVQHFFLVSSPPHLALALFSVVSNPVIFAVPLTACCFVE